jgi:hypothetical protein
MISGLTESVAMIAALSAASERLVAIVKGRIKWLDEPKTDLADERNRRLVLRLMAIISGIVTAALSGQYLVAGSTDYNWQTLVGAGILAGGGSDFWNSTLGYLNALKDKQKKG